MDVLHKAKSAEVVSDSAQCTPSRRARVINTSDTRYHVVRAAAVGLGWRLWDHGTTVRVPSTYHHVSLKDARAVASQRDDWEIIWLDKSVLPSRVSELRNTQRVNHFPGMSAIARKAVLFRRLMAILAQCQPRANTSASTAASGVVGERSTGSRQTTSRASQWVRPSHVCDEDAKSLARVLGSFAPRSFLSGRDLPALEQYMSELAAGSSDAATYFIVKPNKGCQGRGIRVTRTPLDVLTAEERGSPEACLVQLYVDRPLTIEGKKFDLRLYVLLLSASAPRWPKSAIPPAHGADLKDEGTERCQLADPLAGVALFIHESGLVRICAEPYHRPNATNCDDARVHLTNYAVNKTSSAFQRPCAASGLPVSDRDKDAAPAGTDENASSHKRTLHIMPAVIDSATHGGRQWQTDVWRRVQECVTLTVLSGLSVLQRGLEEAGALRSNKADGRCCFELLGFDVMLREGSCEPVLMEVNHSPSLFCDTPLDFAVKERVLADTFRLVEAHMPSRRGDRSGQAASAGGRSGGSEKAYVAASQKQWNRLEAAQLSLVRRGDVLFHQLLPQRVCSPLASTPPGSELPQDEDWTSEEYTRFRTMAALSFLP